LVVETREGTEMLADSNSKLHVWDYTISTSRFDDPLCVVFTAVAENGIQLEPEAK